MDSDAPDTESPFKIVRQQSLVEQVRDRLLGAIVNGDLKPDERLSEADVARRMGISRGPVREAARLLEERGFLRSEPRKGFYVRAVSSDDIKNIHEIRSCISVFAARKAKENATAEDIEALKKLYRKLCLVAAGHDDPLEPLEASYNLQRFIILLTKNPRFVEFFDNIIWESRQLARLVNLADSQSGEYYVKALLPLVNAFEKGTPDEVGEAMHEYLKVNFVDVLSFYHEHPGSIAVT